MTYTNLGDLNKNGQTWNIKVKVIRLWESVNNKTEELMSLDMILMDEKVTFYLFLNIFQLLVDMLTANKL
jgi:hypothetical protein